MTDRAVIARALLSDQTAPEYALHMYPKADRILTALADAGLVVVPREPPHEWDDLTKRYWSQSIKVILADVANG